FLIAETCQPSALQMVSVCGGAARLAAGLPHRRSSRSTSRHGGDRMYYNSLGERVSRRRYREMQEAAKNRRELIAAGLTSRRDLFKMGLLTAGGMLVAKTGLSARASGQSTVNGGVNQLCVPNQPASPPTTGFVQPL